MRVTVLKWSDLSIGRQYLSKSALLGPTLSQAAIAFSENGNEEYWDKNGIPS
jgi:hypothetical protein